MLPNHAPLVIAEQFGTLAALFPGRIDLGLGRAPGTDRATLRALAPRCDGGGKLSRRRAGTAGLPGARPSRARPSAPCRVRARKVPLWILGSSLYGAQLAALLGLPYAFASHFAPDALEQALALYRERFQPSAAARHVLCHGRRQRHRGRHATRRRAASSPRCRCASSAWSATSAACCSRRSTTSRAYWTPREKVHASRMLACSFVGSPATVEGQLRDFVARTGIDELIVASAIYDQQAKLRSFELLKGLSF